MGWQDSHWAQLFSLLGFKPGVLSKETVTLSHFLDKCDAVVANAEAIKSLDATVRATVGLRGHRPACRSLQLKQKIEAYMRHAHDSHLQAGTCAELDTACALLVPQAQGESLIRKALTELQLWALQRKFTFLSSSGADSSASNAGSTKGSGSTAAGSQVGSTQGSRVPLIKDWATVLSEVGDHQSLVASLKTSPYYATFRVRHRGSQ
jgi:dynein heavy chain 2